ncbi:hypothetical protein [Alkalihalobacillus deserti]|uniref:hypothetical protein n=1 Tax=Alkalihalobacillus deserti TaxID=2879466 RepID=UPI001D137F59|nr:hypothetical protein [Alkalihalobacillus deserti]
MKIIVQNEKEIDLVNRFLKDILDQHTQKSSPSLNEDEYRLLIHSLEGATISLDPAEEEMTFSKDDIMSRIMNCRSGSRNDTITYADYSDQQNQPMNEIWENNACWNEDVLE